MDQPLELTTDTRIIVRTDGSIEELPGKQTLEQIEEHINADCLDVVNLRRHGLVMAVNDQGAIIPLAINPIATRFYHAICVPGTTWPICGDVVIVPDADYDD